MEKSTIEKINDFFANNMIAKGTPSNLDEIVHAEKELGIKFDKDYVYFLLNLLKIIFLNKHIKEEH